MNPFRGKAFTRRALASVLGLQPGPMPEADQALADARGDLAEAFARRLGVPVLKRPVVIGAPRVVPNRAERRAELRRTNPELWRADVRGSHSRQLTRKAPPA